jgi:hypothetical protein
MQTIGFPVVPSDVAVEVIVDARIHAVNMVNKGSFRSRNVPITVGV